MTTDIIQTLHTKTRLLTIPECAEILGMTTDELRSAIWVQNFPTSGVGGWGEQMRVNPQTLATELEARKSGRFLGTNPRVMCP
jgi:hypothetical protein